MLPLIFSLLFIPIQMTQAQADKAIAVERELNQAEEQTKETFILYCEHTFHNAKWCDQEDNCAEADYDTFCAGKDKEKDKE